ncbi:MAG: hypothetical protein K9M99_08020 [Candidatus Cloacimonetes bacterium]|nr:hypothetical protein [Candidatus Cloacimonadota bacterium]
MNRYYYLIIILLLSHLGFAQLPDSLQSVSALDSLLLTEAQAMETPADTTKYDPIKLRKDINAFIDQDQNQLNSDWFPWWTLTQNKHYITLKNSYLNIRNNGFRVYSPQMQSIRQVQSRRTFYQLHNTGHSLNLENDYYLLPVTLTDTEAGLGDYRNMHGNFTMRKGHLLGIDSLGVCLNVAGINGYWFGNYDTAANLRLHVFHKFHSGILEYTHATYSEEFSSAMLLEESESELVSRDLSENMLVFKHKFLDAGIKLESGKVGGDERKQMSFLLRKTVDSAFLNYDLSLEYIKETAHTDSSWLAAGGTAEGKWKFAEYNAGFNISDRDNYFYEASLFTGLYRGAGLIAKSYNYSFTDSLLFAAPGKESRSGAGLAWHNDRLKLDVIYGQNDDGLNDDWFLESYLKAYIPWGSFTLLLRNWSFYFLNPEFQTVNEIELVYNLAYHNKVRFQASSSYYTEYYDAEENYIPAAHNLDILLGIGISRNFEIRAEMINMTDNLYLLGEPVSGLHYLFNIYWYFIN